MSMVIMQPLKGVGLVLAGIAGVVALVFLVALYIAGLAWVSENVHEYLNIAATIAVAVCVFILLPCALFRATRKVSVYGLLISSVIFGASTWILGFLVTLQYWGVIGVFVGVIMGVVGIVPLGMLASAFHSDWPTIGMLAVGLVLTFGARMIAIMLAARSDEAGINSNSPSETPRVAWVSVGVLTFFGSLVLVLFASNLNGVSKNTQSTSNSKPVSNSGASPTTKASQSLENADAAYGRGDYATALRLFRPFADQGDVSVQFILGSMYAQGRGVPKNDAEAAKWYRLAADQGVAVAQDFLGNMYSNGTGVPQSNAEAVKWYRLAADQGLAAAQNGLGIVYWNGLSVPRDYAEAVKWFRLAADQGYAEAQNNLGSMYSNGPLPQNYAEAVRWLRLAADQDYADAQYNLGVLYFFGEGVPQNYVNAHMWLNLGAAHGDKNSVQFRDSVQQSMTPAQITEAQKLASEWKPKSISFRRARLP